VQKLALIALNPRYLQALAFSGRRPTFAEIKRVDRFLRGFDAR
jgi:hypothetical protein